ncbi:MAG: hypothetical protein HRF43_02805 [Phycisphaerae bacterium]|jgi:hypothetical protein
MIGLRCTNGRWTGAGLCLSLVALLMAAGCAATATSAGAPAGWLGLDTHLGFPDYDGRWPSAKTRPADRALYFDLIRQLGVPRIRNLTMSWAAVEPRPGGGYDFSLADELVKQARQIRVETLALCWGIPRWAAAAPDGGSVDLGVPDRRHAEAFSAFVRRFVERYDGDGVGDMPGLKLPLRAYEFMNEPEDIPPDEYAFWLRQFHAAVKSADPQAVVVLGSLKSPGLRIADEPTGDYPTYFERLLDAPGLRGPRYPYFDVAAFHNFPRDYPGRPEFDDALAYLRRTMKAHSLDLPVWLTAYGYNSGSIDDAGQAQLQAEYVVKWALRARALGIERVYLHSLWDYRWPGGEGVGENVGLVREAPPGQVPARKPAFEAFAVLLRELKRRPHVAARGPSLYVLTGSTAPVYCIWRERGADPPAAHLSNWWEVRTLTGRSTRVLGPDLTIDHTPRFIERAQSPFIEGIDPAKQPRQ